LPHDIPLGFSGPHSRTVSSACPSHAPKAIHERDYAFIDVKSITSKLF
jgi:hypothetical protein